MTTIETKVLDQSISKMEEQMPSAIVDQTTYDQAVAYGKQVAKMEKYIDAEEKKITAPLNEALKSARALFKPYKTKCEEVKNAVKSSMTAYLAEEAKRKAEQEARDMARLERGTMKEETVVKKMVEREMESTTTTGTTFKHLVIKSVDLSQVPVEFLVLNETLAKAAYKEGREIPGIVFEYETRARL